LRQAKVFKRAAYGLRDMVDLAQLELVKHKDVYVEIPDELALEYHQLAPINDVRVKCVHDLAHPCTREVCRVLSCEERRASLRALEMVGDLALGGLAR